MLRNLIVLGLFFTLLLLPNLAFAIERPVAPTPPSKPVAPEVPAPPDTSGVYDVPERPGLKVRVFAHPVKPTPPPRPGISPSPSPSADGSPIPSASPVVVVNNSLACGLTDPDSNSVTRPAGWKIPIGNWTYQLNLGSVPSSVGSGNLNTMVNAAFSQYAPATGNKVNFLRGADTSTSRARLDGRNIVTWARASSGTLGVTYIWYYPSTGLAVEIDTIMNTRYKWSWSNSLVCADSATYDAQNILTHELGHWMGLTDEYDAAAFGNNTMYGYGAVQEVKKNTLTTGDKSGIGAIYTP